MIITATGSAVARRAQVWGYAYRIRNGSAVPAEKNLPIDESKTGQVFPSNHQKSLFNGR